MKAVLLHSTFAPFHLVQLQAAHAAASPSDELLGLELAGTQSDYRWPPARPQGGVRLQTLFPDRELYSIPRKVKAQAIQAALDSWNPDVVVLPGWGFSHSLAGLSWCIQHRAARVVICDSHPLREGDGRVKRWLKGFLVRRYQAAFVAGNIHARYVASFGLPLERCFIGCDTVDNRFFASAPPQPAASRPPTLLSCLRLLPRKNALGVLEALAKAPEWHWVLAGDGAQLEEVRATRQRLGLEKRVHLLGHVPYEELPALYARADIYLQPSLYEPWGLAVNEAMAASLPVIVSDRCGSAELVHGEGNGYVFDPTRPDALPSALNALLARRSEWLAMGAASHRIIQEWGPDLFANNFWKASRSALELNRARPQPNLMDRAMRFAV